MQMAIGKLWVVFGWPCLGEEGLCGRFAVSQLNNLCINSQAVLSPAFMNTK